MPPVGPVAEPVRQLIVATLPAIQQALRSAPDRVDTIIAAFLASLPKNPLPAVELR